MDEGLEGLKRLAATREFPEAAEAFKRLAVVGRDPQIEDLCVIAMFRAVDNGVIEAAIICLESHASPRGISELSRFVMEDSGSSSGEVAAFHLRRLSADAAEACLASLKARSGVPARIEDALAGRLKAPNYC